MKNPTEPNFKTEGFPLLTISLSLLTAFYFRSYLPADLILSWNDIGEPNKTISWSLLTYLWPIVLSLIYAMFLFFPYFKINHQESAILKEQWHKAKELSLVFFFTLQVIAGLILSGQNQVLIWALPILFLLLIASLVPTIIQVIKYRKKIPLKL